MSPDFPSPIRNSSLRPGADTEPAVHIRATESLLGRVLLLAPQPFYEDRGTPIAVRQLLLALSFLGYMVDVVTFPMGRQVAIPGAMVFRCANPFNIRTVPIGFSLKKIVLDICMIPRIYQRLASTQYVCIHAVEEAAFSGMLLGRLFGVPLVYDMQSSMPEQMKELRIFRYRPLQTLLFRCERWLVANSDWVMSSAGLACRIRQISPNTRVQEWSYVGQRRPSDTSETADLRLALRIPENAPVVVYAGSFEAYQGLPLLLGAMPHILRRFPNTVFVLVGGNGRGEAVVRRMARDSGLLDNLRLIARQPRKRISAFLSLADVLVSPRTQGENLPLKIFDYLAAGRPIVATDIPAHRAFLSDQVAVLTIPAAPALADAVVRLLQDPAQAAALGAAAFEFSGSRFGWDRLVDDVNRVYSRLGNRIGRARV